jgi:hypothetical protein
LQLTFCKQAPAGFGRIHSRLAGKTFESKFTLFAAQNKREAHCYSAAKKLVVSPLAHCLLLAVGFIL